MRTCLFALITAGFLLLPHHAPPALAQAAGTTLIVTVETVGAGTPVRNAQVVLDGAGLGGLTDAGGRIRFTGLRPGHAALVVHSVGFIPARQEVLVTGEATQTVSILLAMRAVELPAVTVRADANTRVLAARGFYARKANGIGQFITREQIDARKPLRLSDMLTTLPGIDLGRLRMGDGYQATMRRASAGPSARRCPIQYFLDGVVLLGGFNIDDIPARDVQAIELYYGASQIPAEFNQRTAMCGVIAVWTRVQ